MKQENEKLISSEETQPEQQTPGGNSRAITPPYFDQVDPDTEVVTNQDFVKNGAVIQESFGTNSTLEVNLHKGKLCFVQQLFTAQGNHLPVIFSIAYNDRFAFNSSTNDGKPVLFKGWKLNYQQFIRFTQNKCVYLDGAYKEHIFEKSTNNADVYLDTSTQSGAILRPVSGGYEIFDGANTTLLFQSNRLVKITQAKGASPVETTITYDGLNRVTQVTDGVGKTYTVNYTSDGITITDSNNVVLVTLTPDAENHLASIKYYEDNATNKQCLFSYITLTSRLSSVQDQLTQEKMSFTYNVTGKLLSIKKYASNSNGDTPLHSAFLTYGTNQTIVTKNNGTDQNYAHIRHRYNFNSTGVLTSSYEIDSSGKPIGNQSYAYHDNGIEKQTVYKNINKFVLADESSQVAAGPGIMVPYAVEVGRKTIALPNYYQGRVDLKFAWTFNYESWYPELEEDKNIVFEIYVNNTAAPIATVEYPCLDTFPREASFEVKDVATTGNTLVMLKVVPPETENFVYVTNATVYCASTATKQMRIRYMPPHDIAFSQPVYITETVNDQPRYWFPLDGLYFQSSAGTITPSVFSVADYQRTMLSYFCNPNSFNFYYNDGAKVAYGITWLKGIYEDFEADWEYLPLAALTTSGFPQTLENCGVDGNYVLFYQRELGKAAHSTHTKLDRFLRVVEEYQRGDDEDAYGEQVKRYYYDNFGNAVNVRLGNLRETTNYTPDGQHVDNIPNYIQSDSKTTYIYNANTNVLESVQDPKGALTNFSYQNRTMLSGLNSSVDTAANSIAYDGAFITQLTHNGTTFNFTYDSRNNVSGVSVADATLLSKSTSYTTDGSHTTQLMYGNGYTVKAYYDKHGRIVRICSVSGASETILATYIYADEKVSNTTTSPNYSATSTSILQKAIDEVAGLVYTYTYDVLGTCTQVEVCLKGTTQQKLVKTFTYDTLGRVSKLQTQLEDNLITQVFTYAHSRSTEVTQEQTIIGENVDEALFYGKFFMTSYVRDDLKRIASISRTVDNSNIYQGYQYRQRREQSEITGTMPLVSRVYTSGVDGQSQQHDVDYDINGNIIQYGATTYEYDGLNRLVRENNPLLNKTFTWTYDAGGNISTRTEYAYTTGALSTGTTVNYAYNSSWKDKLTSFNGQSITYDHIGNPLTYGNKTFTWTRGRLLSKLSTPNQTVNFKYDSSGLRTQKSIGSTYYDYLYDGNKLLQMSIQTPSEWNNMTFVYDEQGVIGFNYKGKNYVYIRNLFGDITEIHDQDHCVAKYTYDAWGNCAIVSDTGGIGAVNPFRYRGYIFDKETNLYYCNSRYYSPEWGRFINADTIDYLDPESINGLNLYAYCYNNPIMFADPSGHAAATFGVLAIVAIVASSMIMAGIAQIVSNAIAGESGSDLWRGVAGAVLGAGANALALCLSPFTGGVSLVFAALIGAVVQTSADVIEAKIRGEDVTLGQTISDFTLNFVTTFAGNWLGATTFPTNRGWFKPQKFWSVFTKPYGQIILLQTSVGATLSGVVNFSKKFNWDNPNWRKYIPEIQPPKIPGL